MLFARNRNVVIWLILTPLHDGGPGHCWGNGMRFQVSVSLAAMRTAPRRPGNSSGNLEITRGSTWSRRRPAEGQGSDGEADMLLVVEKGIW